MVRLGKHRVGEERVGLLKVEVDGEAASLLLLLLLGLLGRDGLERFAGDVDEVLERLLVLLGDLLRDRLVVAKRAQPEIRDALRRLLGFIRNLALAGRAGIDVHLALDDGGAFGVERGVEAAVFLLQGALLLEKLLAELVVGLLDVAERVDASAHLVVQGLDETAGEADEAVKLGLKRADEAGVTAELAERLHHFRLVDALGELWTEREGGREIVSEGKSGAIL